MFWTAGGSITLLITSISMILYLDNSSYHFNMAGVYTIWGKYTSNIFIVETNDYLVSCSLGGAAALRMKLDVAPLSSVI